MSLQTEPIFDVPELTSQVAQAAFAKGNIYMLMRDELGVFYDNEQFRELFSHTGQPAIAAWRLALVTVMQFVENLTDRQAADAVRSRIDWKYALGLEITDPGFHYSVLSEFRGRLLAGDQETLLFEAMLDCFKSKELLKSGKKQRTDSTYIVGAVRRMNQLELVHETLRHALNELAVEAPAWLKRQVTADWFDHYSHRTSSSLLPKKESERQAWAERVGRDGFFLLRQLYHEGSHPELIELQAMATLRLVWIQNFYEENGAAHLRGQEDQPPTARRIASPYDLEVHYSTKRDIKWTGYKVHLTETCNPDSPNLITNVETRPSTEPDHEVTHIIHQHLAEKARLPAEHFVDKGYMSVDHLIQAQQDYDITLMDAVPDDNSWQARRQGYDSRQFTIDWANEVAYCPQKHQSCSWSLAKTRSQRPVVKIKFRRKDCRACEAISLCTNNRERRRTLTVLAPQFHFETQQNARQRQQTTPFKELCKVRAGVEGTISQLAYAFGARRSRYRGLAKTHLQHLVTAASINLLRVINWLNDVPRSVTPSSHFARLAL